MNSEVFDYITKPYMVGGSHNTVFDLDGYKMLIDSHYSDYDLNDFDISVLTIKSYQYDRNRPDSVYSKNCIRRKQEIFNFFRRRENNNIISRTI